MFNSCRYKELAFAILKRTKELERRKPENDVVKLLPITKKNGRKFSDLRDTFHVNFHSFYSSNSV